MVTLFSHFILLFGVKLKSHHHRYPLPEQDIDAELGLHDEEVWGGDEAGHQFRVYVGEAVRVLGHVAKQVRAQPAHAALEEENSRVRFKKIHTCDISDIIYLSLD